MAVLRFQKNAGISASELSKVLPAGSLSSISSPSPSEFIDVTVTPAGVSDCTDFMATKGYTLVATDPVTTLESAASAAVPPVTQVKLGDSTVLTFSSPASGEALVRSGTTIVGSPVAAFDLRDSAVWDHFISGNTDADEYGSAGWRTLVSGSGAALVATATAGHPGIVQLDAGTAAAARAAIYLGESSALGNWSIAGSQNMIMFEWLVRLVGATTLLTGNLERLTFGFGDAFDAGAGVEHSNGVYVEFNPAASSNWILKTASSGVLSASVSSSVVAATTWYRVGVEVTYPGGVPSAQLKVNGVSSGTPITTNIPSTITGYGFRVDSGAAVASAAIVQADYTRVIQVSNKED